MDAPTGFSSGNTYFVSANGAADGDGRHDNPFTDFETALVSLEAGDTLYVREGTYTPNSEIRLKFQGNTGTESTPVTISGYPGEAAVFDLKNVDNFIHLDNKSHWTFQDLAFENVQQAFIVGQDVPSHHNTFQDLSFDVTRSTFDNSAAIKASNGNAEYLVISDNVFTGLTEAAADLRTTAIYVNRLDNVEITGNDISGFGDAVRFKHANAGAEEDVNIEIAYNFFHDLAAGGAGQNYNHAHIHDNVYLNVPYVSVATANGVPGGDYNLIENNTFINAQFVLANDTQNGDPGVPGAYGNIVQNNIFTQTVGLHQYATPRYGYSNGIADMPHDATLDGNFYVTETGVVINEAGQLFDLEAWQAYSGLDTNSISGQAQFVGGETPATLEGVKLIEGSLGADMNVGADVDAILAHSSESGETVGPDLTAQSLELSADNWRPGDSVGASWEIQNNGTEEAGASTSTVYLSTDANVTTADLAIMTYEGGDTIDPNGIDQQEGRFGSFVVPDDLAPGTYYVAVIADSTGAVTELDENNNMSNVVTITIGEAAPYPDIVIVEGDGDIRTTQFSTEGQRVSLTIEDVSDARTWSTKVNNYDVNGQILNSTLLMDNGSVVASNFEAGVRSQKVTTEADGDIRSTTYGQDGIRDSFEFTDVSDARKWVEYSNVYDDNGGLMMRTMVMDNGRIFQTIFEDGVTVSRTEIFQRPVEAKGGDSSDFANVEWGVPDMTLDTFL